MKRLLTIIPVAALALAACGSDDEAVSIDDAWARTSAEGQTTGAIYFEITAEDGDTLIGASVPASVASDAQIHEVVPAAETDMGDEQTDMGDEEMSDDGDHGGMDMGDGEMAMTMQELVDGLPLPAGETVVLQPGGYHVMLLDLAEPLEVGDEIELTLDFENADDTTLTVEVAESAP